MEQEEKLLAEVSADVIKAHISVPLDAERVYDYDIEQHCRPVPSDIKEPQAEDAINIMFDSETYNNKRGKPGSLAAPTPQHPPTNVRRDKIRVSG